MESSNTTAIPVATGQQTFVRHIDFSDPDYSLGYFIESLKEYKVVHLYNIPAGADYKDFYSELVDSAGTIVNVDEDIKTGNASTERWTDVRYDKENAFTFRHANTRQPLHTDAAYTSFDLDVNFFFCMEAAEIGGATTFFDSVDLMHILTKFEPELLEQLQSTEVDFGKGGNQAKTRRIIDEDGRGIKLNWNYFRVMPENTAPVREMCEAFHQFLEGKIVGGGLLTEVYLKPGEAVFFQDDRCLHGRNSFYGSRNLIKGGFNFK